MHGFISGAGNDHISFRVEEDIRYVVIMPEESLETLVVVVEVPQFDCEVGRAGS